MQSRKSQDFGHGLTAPKDVSTLNHTIQQNIQAINEHRKQAARRRAWPERFADVITGFSGDMRFVALHVIWFAAWFLLNSGWSGMQPFDPFPYGLLTMIVSLEAIFLSTFVLISQNRMSKQDQERAELDLQINLLTEHELTKVLVMLEKIEDRLGIDSSRDTELGELEKDTSPDDILNEIEREEGLKKRKKP